MSQAQVPSMQVHLLGGFQVQIGGQALPEDAWARSAARTLVKLLALTPGHRLHRDQVLDTLWPESAPDPALNALRKALHAARETLEPGRTGRGASSYIRMGNDILALDEGITVDVDRFETLAASALASGAGPDIAEALAAYTGPLLPDDLYEDWTVSRRETLAELRVRLLRRQAENLQRQGEHERAADVLAALLVDDPTDEATHLELMRLYAAAGSRHRVLRQYQILRDVLTREFGVAPNDETQALYEEILRASTRVASPSAVRQAPILPPLLRRKPVTPLVGRQRVAAILDEAAQRARAGEGAAVLVSGEAGVGKTRLVTDLARTLSADGMLVLWGASYGGDLPYGPFVDALSDFVGQLPRAECIMLAAQYPELTPLIPALLHEGRDAVTAAGASSVSAPSDGTSVTKGRGAAPVGSDPRAADGERTRLFTAIVRLLSDLADGAPLLLVLDDLHLADAASIHLLHHILRSTASSSWLVIGMYREGDVETGGDLRRLLITGARDGLTRTVSLLRLAREDADRLVQAVLADAPVEPGLLDEVWRLSLGNPLFLNELLRSMKERGEIMRDDGGWRLDRHDENHVPDRIGDLVSERVSRMGPDVAHALGVASVIGIESTYDLLLGAASLDGRTLLDALDRALAAHILEERGRGYAFRHPLMRTALYDGLSAQRRTQTHAAVALAIERLHPGAVDDLAYHYTRSSDIERAILYLERAGDRARTIYANVSAERNYRELIALLEERGGVTAAIRARIKLSETLQVASRYDDALHVLEPALEACRTMGDRGLLAEVLGRMGTLYSPLGRCEEGLAFLKRYVPEVENDANSEGLGHVFLALSRLTYRLERMPESYAAAIRAGEIARAIGNQPLLADALMRQGTTMYYLFAWAPEVAALGSEITPENSLRILDSARALCEEIGDVPRLLPIVGNLGLFSCWAGQFRRYAEYSQRWLELSERVGNAGGAAQGMAHIGRAFMLLGEMDRALPHLEASARQARGLTAMVQHAIPFINLAAALTVIGKWEQVTHVLDEAEAASEGDPSNQRVVAGLRAESELAQGRPKVALGFLEKHVTTHREGNEPDEIIHTLAHAYAEAGDMQRAQHLIETAIATSEREGNAMWLAERLVIQGRIYLLQADTPGALNALDRAQTLSAAMPYPYMLAQALYLQGIARRSTPTEAEPLLLSALEIFRRLGATPSIVRTEAALTELLSTQKMK